MALNFERLVHAFFIPVDDVDFYCIDCRLVSGSYVNTQVSSQVIIEFNKSGTFSVHCKRSKHNSLQSSFVHLTALLEPFLHEPFSCSILPFYPVQIDFLSYCSNTQILVFLNHNSHFSNAVIGNSCVCGRPGLSSSFALSLPSENCLCHSNTCARDMQSSL